MKFKTVCVSLVCTFLLLYIQNVYAVYPDSVGTVAFNEVYNVPGTQSWTPSPEENIFTVDGKSFIILDTDEDGNYFVLSEEHYGTHIFEEGIPNKIELQTAVTENGDVSFEDKGADLTDSDSWRFNPERETNIAYWLNNDFIESGNTSQYIFPERVYDHIIEKTWQTEGFDAFRGWTANDYYDKPLGVSNALEFAESFSGDSYSFDAKLSLLSYAEYMQYKDKIGVTFNNAGGWSGMMLRTCDAMVTASVSGNVRSISMMRSPLMVRTSSIDQSNNSSLVVAYADAIAADNYFVRPCFWLSKDFFKEVPCELEWDEDGNVSIGSVPLAEIKKHTYNELKTIYSDGQLESLGYQIPERDWGNYPDHPSDIKDLGAGENSGTGIGAYYKSPEENLFFVEDKSFILLDKDKDGNYFVMANDEYGQRIFSEFSCEDMKECTEEDWCFDPENPDSIAYWLNNAFLTDGNRFKNETEVWILPEAVRESMIEYEWETEPNYPIYGWTVAEYASEAVKQEIDSWQAGQLENSKKRTASCKVSLMSYTEYQQYRDKIGLEKLAEGYAGFTLRTPRAQVNASDDGESWSVLLGPLQIANSTSLNELAVSTAGAFNDIYYLRPVFWLSKDFFSKNALDIDKMGENVKLEISDSYDYYDLRHIYTDDQMRKLSVNPQRDVTSSVPSADNVVIEGIPSAGSLVLGNYRYLSEDIRSDAAAERNSVYKWYLSDTADSQKTLCSRESVYIPKEQEVGKYLHFSVTPQNAYGIASDKEYFSRAVKVLPAQTVSVTEMTFTNENGDPIYNLNGIKSLNVKLKLIAQDECDMFLIAYDIEGRMLGLEIYEVLPGDNETEMTLENISAGGGAYCRIIIFDKENPAEPVYSIRL